MQLDIWNHLRVADDLPKVTAQEFCIEEFINASLTTSETSKWGTVRADWPLVDEAITRLAVFTSNTIYYDNHPLYIHCLRCGLASHYHAVLNSQGDRRRLQLFADAVVQPITVYSISLNSKEGVCHVPDSSGGLDRRLLELERSAIKIMVTQTPHRDVKKNRDLLLRNLFMGVEEYSEFGFSNEVGRD